MGNQVSFSRQGNIKSIQDLRSRTKFSKDALLELRRRFEHATPANNRLSKPLFKKLVRESGYQGDMKLLESLFDVFDKNHNGLIDYPELAVGLSLFLATDNEEALLQAVFDMYDISGDHYLSRDEMIRVLETLHKVIHIPEFTAMATSTHSPRSSYVHIMNFVDKIFKEFDMDFDHRLDYTEFRKAVHKYPAVLEGSQVSLKEVFRKLLMPQDTKLGDVDYALVDHN